MISHERAIRRCHRWARSALPAQPWADLWRTTRRVGEILAERAPRSCTHVSPVAGVYCPAIVAGEDVCGRSVGEPPRCGRSAIIRYIRRSATSAGVLVRPRVSGPRRQQRRGMPPETPCQRSSANSFELQTRECTKRLATKCELRDDLLHLPILSHAVVRPHVSMICVAAGSVHRVTSPPNPRVMMSSPSKWIPSTWDLCACNVQVWRPIVASQNRSRPSPPPAKTTSHALRPPGRTAAEGRVKMPHPELPRVVPPPRRARLGAALVLSHHYRAFRKSAHSPGMVCTTTTTATAHVACSFSELPPTAPTTRRRSMVASARIDSRRSTSFGVSVFIF